MSPSYIKIGPYYVDPDEETETEMYDGPPEWDDEDDVPVNIYGEVDEEPK